MGASSSRGVSMNPGAKTNIPGMAAAGPWIDHVGGRTTKKVIERLTARYPGYKPAASLIVVAPLTNAHREIFNPADAGNRDEYNAAAAAAHARTRAGLKVLMVRKEPPADPMLPQAWSFPSGDVSHADDTAADTNANFTEQMMGGAFPALPERAAALRALFTEARLSLNRNGELRDSRWTRIDYSGAGSLVPFSRWVSPLDAPTKFDRMTFITTVTHDQLRKFDKETNPAAPAAPVGDGVGAAAWVDPRDAVARHGSGDGFQLAFPDLVTIHYLARFSDATGAACDARDRFTYDLTDMPRVQPRVEMDPGTRQITVRLMLGATHLAAGEHFFPSGVAAADGHPEVRVVVEGFDAAAPEFVPAAARQHVVFEPQRVW